MKFNYFLASLLVSSFSLFTTLPASAEIIWESIPGTKTLDESGRNIDFWYIGRNTISRKGDAINFDVNAYRVYARYSANCKTHKMSRIRLGGVKNDQIIAVKLYQEPFFEANELQGKALNYACSLSYR